MAHKATGAAATTRTSMTREELIALLEEHVTIRVKDDYHMDYGHGSLEITVELVVNPTDTEKEVIISTDSVSFNVSR